MSLTPTMIDALLAAGGTAEQLAALVKADIADQEARKAAKRENNAERQQRFRDRRKSRKDNARNALQAVIPPKEDQTPASHISPSGESENKPRRQRGGVCARPDDVPEPLWVAWVAHRQKHKSDAGQTTIDAYRCEAVEVGWTLEQVLTEQIQRGWRGFKAKWVKDDGQSGQRNGFSRQGSTRDLGMEIARELAEPRTDGGVVDLVPRLSAPGRTYG